MDLEIYCAECRPELFSSREKNVPYLSIGGIWIPAHDRQKIKNSIQNLRKKYNV